MELLFEMYMFSVFPQKSGKSEVLLLRAYLLQEKWGRGAPLSLLHSLVFWHQSLNSIFVIKDNNKDVANNSGVQNGDDS